jgi:signal transduction histidine kinase
MLDWLLAKLGYGPKELQKRIEESPGELVIDIKRIRMDWTTLKLRIPIAFDFPPEK